MRKHEIAALFLAGCACLLLAACQANEETPPVESVFQSLLKLSAGDAADNDGFGTSIAHDGGYALVGAPGVDGDEEDEGAAYLFLQSQGGADKWGQVAKIVAADGALDDYFGTVVDISGDYAVVGASRENGLGSNQGSAYIFYRSQGGPDSWGQVKKIMAADFADQDYFGSSVAIDGDTLVVGATGEDGSGTDQGAAYVFYRNQGGADNWGQAAKLVSGNPAQDNGFGYAVDVKGDIIVVSSPNEAGDAAAGGIVYVFSRNLGGADAWGAVKAISAGDAEDSASFGWSVATDGTRLVVGAIYDDGDGYNRGAAYLFGKDEGGTDNWGEVKKLTASDARDEEYFGGSVDLYGDYVIAGAYASRGGGTERGQVYLFAKDEGGTDNWGEAQRLRAGDGTNNDWFGIAVAIEGSYVFAGAMGEDGAGAERGAAYVFKKS